nr:MAG TPA: hypothetical protein [Caudoviricetes sp.]
MVHSSTFVKTRDCKYNISEIFALSGYCGVEKCQDYALLRSMVLTAFWPYLEVS